MKLSDLSILLSLAALGWGLFNQRRADELAERLANVRTSHYRLADQSRETLARLEAEARTLRHQVRALQGDGALFQPDMTIGEAVALDPRVTEVLGGFHIGGCSSCAVSPEDSLAQAATANGQDPAQVLAALNKLPTEAGASLLQQLERKPNVQLSL